MLLHQSVQLGQLRATTLVVNRDAIGCTVGLPNGGLHALLMSRLWFFTVSDCATRRHCPLWCLPNGARLLVPTARFISRIGSPKSRAPKPDGHEHLLMAGTVSTRSRQKPDFGDANSACLCQVSAMSANWRCRP